MLRKLSCYFRITTFVLGQRWTKQRDEIIFPIIVVYVFLLDRLIVMTLHTNRCDALHNNLWHHESYNHKM